MIELQNVTAPASGTSMARAKEAYEQLLQQQEIGFTKVCDQSIFWDSTLDRGTWIRENYDRLIVVGIGGSSLGARAVTGVVGSSDVRVSFLENVDGLAAQRFFNNIYYAHKVHWLFVSKSGQTRETLTLIDFISQWLVSKKIKLEDHCTVVTGAQRSPLYDWMNRKSISHIEFPENIGGRFSVLSPVGMLPAAVAGHDLDGYRRGANWCLSAPELTQKLVALSLDSFDRNERLTAFWFYSSLFGETGRWVQQLWAESLGKKNGRDGLPAAQASVPLPLIGSVDQHSMLQQISEGAEKKFIWFVRVAECEKTGQSLESGTFVCKTKMQGKPMGALLAAFAQSTQKALYRDGVQSLTLKLESADEEHLGALLMLLMLTVGALGEALNINAFDQPGVEHGKRLVADYL